MPVNQTWKCAKCGITAEVDGTADAQLPTGWGFLVCTAAADAWKYALCPDHLATVHTDVDSVYQNK